MISLEGMTLLEWAYFTAEGIGIKVDTEYYFKTGERKFGGSIKGLHIQYSSDSHKKLFTIDRNSGEEEFKVEIGQDTVLTYGFQDIQDAKFAFNPNLRQLNETMQQSEFLKYCAHQIGYENPIAFNAKHEVSQINMGHLMGFFAIQFQNNMLARKVYHETSIQRKNM